MTAEDEAPCGAEEEEEEEEEGGKVGGECQPAAIAKAAASGPWAEKSTAGS